MGAKARKKRDVWMLPKTFVERPVNKQGYIQRADGEPRFYPLVKHGDDRSLCADQFVACCDCGLEHHHTFNVVKTPDGKWWLVVRAYRMPGMEKSKWLSNS